MMALKLHVKIEEACGMPSTPIPAKCMGGMDGMC